MNIPQKRYIVWIHNGGNQYVPYEYDTIEEAIIADKSTNDWYLTESINHIGSVYAGFKQPTPPEAGSEEKK